MPRIDDPKSPALKPRQAATPAKPAAPGDAAEQVAKMAGDVFHPFGLAKTVSVAPAEKQGFFGRLWDGVKEKASSALDWVKGAAASAGNGVMKLVMGVSSDQFKTRKVYDDPSDVNHPSDDEVAAAKAAIQANAAKVEAAVGKLSAADRKHYEAVSALTAGRPTSQAALETMLLDGRLTAGKDLKGEGSALDHLAKLGAQDLAKGVDRKKLVAEVIGELENPVRINQHSVGTCGATTAQILLIRKNPAEYVRLLEGLASPAGKATMAGGDTIGRVSDWNTDNDGDRTTSSRLFQPAVMDYGEPLPGDAYDNSEDRDKLGPIPLFGGLMSLTKISSQLTGKPYDGTTFFAWNRDKGWKHVTESLAASQGPIPVAVRWNSSGSPGGHFVQIDKVEKGQVYITNPWGQREKFDEAEFRAHVTASYIPE